MTLRAVASPAELACQDRGLRVSEAARRLGYDRATIVQMLEDGRLAGFNAGKPGGRRSLRVYESSLVELQSRPIQRAQGTPVPPRPRPRVRPIDDALTRQALANLERRGIRF